MCCGVDNRLLVCGGVDNRLLVCGCVSGGVDSRLQVCGEVGSDSYSVRLRQLTFKLTFTVSLLICQLTLAVSQAMSADTHS